MELDIYALAKAGLNQQEIKKITEAESKELQIRWLQKYRCKLLEDIHGKQQSLDILDYMICKLRE